ncbi:MAG: hypothetical protein AVDCRST_MAG79-2239, partial [uncultured Thermoleophilia bacterium]
ARLGRGGWQGDPRGRAPDRRLRGRDPADARHRAADAAAPRRRRLGPLHHRHLDADDRRGRHRSRPERHRHPRVLARGAFRAPQPGREPGRDPDRPHGSRGAARLRACGTRRLRVAGGRRGGRVGRRPGAEPRPADLRDPAGGRPPLGPLLGARPVEAGRHGAPRRRARPGGRRARAVLPDRGRLLARRPRAVPGPRPGHPVAPRRRPRGVAATRPRRPSLRRRGDDRHHLPAHRDRGHDAARGRARDRLLRRGPPRRGGGRWHPVDPRHDRVPDPDPGGAGRPGPPALRASARARGVADPRRVVRARHGDRRAVRDRRRGGVGVRPVGRRAAHRGGDAGGRLPGRDVGHDAAVAEATRGPAAGERGGPRGGRDRNGRARPAVRRDRRRRGHGGRRADAGRGLRRPARPASPRPAGRPRDRAAPRRGPRRRRATRRAPARAEPGGGRGRERRLSRRARRPRRRAARAAPGAPAAAPSERRGL